MDLSTFEIRDSSSGCKVVFSRLNDDPNFIVVVKFYDDSGNPPQIIKVKREHAMRLWGFFADSCYGSTGGRKY